MKMIYWFFIRIQLENTICCTCKLWIIILNLFEAVNTYWNENGRMFLDPDSYRIVISPLKATKLN
ncbi:hypothetical protein [Flavobacterium ustbae]|uniref:hypothetical protein n=1 Tax=Flavobacterium ustbae TaxID=2488790 RepID=UPI003742B271